MSSTKEIKNKIVSVINTKKITKAMEMVAASKIKKTEERMLAMRPYTNLTKKIINHVIQGNLEYKHVYLKNKTTINRIGIIIVSTDKGLCGSLNSNLFKKVLLKMQLFAKNNISCSLVLFGLKSFSIFKFCNANIILKVKDLGENPDILKLLNSISVLLKEYRNHKISKVFIAYNKFHNKMLYLPKIIQLLPLSKTKIENIVNKNTWDYLYESESTIILDVLFNRYIESQVYQSVLENIASEQAARMIAMKTATDNSINRIQELQLLYNKIRQSNITQELTEIIAGASAV